VAETPVQIANCKFRRIFYSEIDGTVLLAWYSWDIQAFRLFRSLFAENDWKKINPLYHRMSYFCRYGNEQYENTGQKVGSSTLGEPSGSQKWGRLAPSGPKGLYAYAIKRLSMSTLHRPRSLVWCSEVRTCHWRCSLKKWPLELRMMQFAPFVLHASGAQESRYQIRIVVFRACRRIK